MNTTPNPDARIERLQTMYGALADITVRATLNPQEIASNANSIGFCMQEVLNMVKEEQEKDVSTKEEKEA